MTLMDKAAIEAVLPHRDPMLLVDEVLELVPGERVVARKTVTADDCAGHFPGNPIMPGVKMVEALAQCGAVAVLSQPENRGKLALFAGIDDVRFKRDRSSRRDAHPRVRDRDRSRARRTRPREGDGRRSACGARDAHLRCVETASDRPRERAADLDHWARVSRARPRRDERRALAARRHVRRVDRRRAPGSASAGWPTGRSRCPISRCRPVQRALEMAGVDPAIDRPADRRHGDARHGVPVDGGAAGRPARHAGRGRVRPLGRLHRLRVRDRPGATG